MMRTINTPQGEVKLLDPPVELLRTIRSLLPFGVARFRTVQEGADYGIVMKCGDQEVHGVKQQPVPCEKTQGLVAFKAHNILIAHILRGVIIFRS